MWASVYICVYTMSVGVRVWVCVCVVWMWVLSHVWVCLCAQVCVCLCVSSILYLTYWDTNPLALASTRLASQLALCILCFCLPSTPQCAGFAGGLPCLPHIWVGAEELSGNPHACTVSASPSEPLPRSLHMWWVGSLSKQAGYLYDKSSTPTLLSTISCTNLVRLPMGNKPLKVKLILVYLKINLCLHLSSTQ